MEWLDTIRAKSVEAGRVRNWRRGMTKRSPFRYGQTGPEIIRLAVMMYVRFPLSLRNVEDLLHERGIDISHETVRFWPNRFGPLFASLFLQ
jgi:putative transposase